MASDATAMVMVLGTMAMRAVGVAVIIVVIAVRGMVVAAVV